MYLTSVKDMLRKVSISLLLGLMVVSSFSIVSPGTAEAVSIDPIDLAMVADLNEDRNVVTVTASVYATHAGSVDDLKAAITLSRTGETTFLPLGLNDTVNLTNTESSVTLVMTLIEPLTGVNNKISIASGALVDPNGDAYGQVYFEKIIGLDVTPPAYAGSSSYRGNGVYLNFDEDFTIATEDEDSNAFLKSQMSITTDGVIFVPMYENSNIHQNGSNQIYINYYDEMKVIVGRNTAIKIAGGTIKDAKGNLNEEMTFDISPPFIESAVISSDNHDVTITFHEDVFVNTLQNQNQNGFSIQNAAINLKDYIYLLRDGANSDWLEMTEQDTASIVSGKLVIHFAQALIGDNNVIVINDDALMDKDGNVISDDIRTSNIVANAGVEEPDVTAPEFVEYYLSNSNQDLTLVFNESVMNNLEDISTFIQQLYTYNSQEWTYGLPTGSTVDFLDNQVIIHFSAPLTGYRYYMQINPGSIKDTSGNTFNNYVNFNYYPQHSLEIDGGAFSNNGQSLNLSFNVDLVDKTLVDGISYLNERIKILTDQGTFSPLSEQDIVLILNDRLYILFNDAKKSGSVRVKIEAGALGDKGGNVTNEDIEKVVASNTPNLTGLFLSNTASEFTFEDNVEWRSKVREVILYDQGTNALRPLNSSEYSLTAGKLTINSDAFEQFGYYNLYVNADGYSSRNVSGPALKSSEIFFMSTPVITIENGITATMDLLSMLSDYNNGTQVVVFELMNGNTPVSIVTSTLKVGTGKYSANFNVKDAATNPDYRVKAFILDKYSTDLTSVGTNFGTVLPKLEFDFLKMLYENENENRP
jgi:hypothetical protein